MMSKAITRGLTPSVGGTLARNPSFTLGVLDSEEFTRGFLTPIEPKTFAYFWDQGWPRELLLYLFVQRAEIGSEVYLNYPGDWQEYVKFARWVEHFLETQPTVESKEKPIPIGPLLDSTKIEGLGDLVKASKDGLRVQWCTNELESSDGKAQLCDGSPQTEGERSGWQLERVRVEYHLKPTLVPCQGSADKCHKEEGATAEQETMLGPPTPDSAGGEEQDRLVLRSPEAVLYYLGELTRFANQTTDLWIPLVCIQGEFQPLFLAVPRSKQCEAPLVEAHSPWGEYVVAQTRQDRQHLAWESECREVRASCDIAHDDGPRGESDYLEWKTGGQKPCELCERAHKADAAGCQCRPGALIREDGKLESCDSGRSMQALRLLSQLISLQKSADELPSPALVRVIGN